VGDVTALSERVLQLVADADLRQRLGQAAYTQVQAYDVQQMADQYTALYQELLGTQSNPT
jgi:glycosyltransferase involved in cell wall biosynthesis